MKKSYFPFLLLTSLVALWGCGGNGNAISMDDQKEITFDLSNEAVDIFSLDILDEPIVLNLANDSILVSDPSQAVSFRNRTYLLDGNHSNMRSIVIVGEDGQIHRQIKRIGRGPLEYIGLEHIFVDKTKELLGAYSRQDQKIIYFDLDGNIRNEVETPQRFASVWPTDRGFAGFMGNFSEDKKRRDNLWLMDSSLKLQESFFEIPASWESIGLSFMPFSEYDEKTYYTRLLENDVYAIEGDSVTARYRFDFGKNNWPESESGYQNWRRITDTYPGRYISKLDRVQETDRYVITQFLHEGQARLGVYDKVSEKSFVCSMEVYAGKYFIPFGAIAGIDADAIYTIIPAHQVRKMWEGKDEYNNFESNYPNQIRKLREDFPQIDENGNPFLVMYRFKK